jgi:hypothetical protein
MKDKTPQKTCFVMSPIDDERSSVRKRSDVIMKYLIRPVCEKTGYMPQRADEIEEPGMISKKIIRNILTSDLVIADLTGHNPNVFYELAIRHISGKPTIQLIEQNEKIPFDIAGLSTIIIDYKDIESLEKCKMRLISYIKNSHKEPYENPIADVVRSMNFKIPYMEAVPSSLEEKFAEFSSKILNEIKILRTDRELLLQSLINKSESQIEEVTDDRTSSLETNISGTWNSNLGLVRLIQDGKEIFGQYQVGVEWIGKIFGKCFGNLIIFHWEWSSSKFTGFGFWEIDNNSLKGGWFYNDESITYGELLQDQNKINELVVDEANMWELTRVKA